MPRGNRMGPQGTGPMTGRGAGFCAGYGVPGYANPAWGAGAGMMGGGGFGRGWRHWYHATGLPGWARAGVNPAWGAPAFTAGPSPEQEASLLKMQAGQLRTTLTNLERRLADLESAQPKPQE